MLLEKAQLAGAAVALGTLAAGIAVTGAVADDDDDRIRVRLSGFHEDPPVSTAAFGEFRMTITRDEDEATYRLSYSGLEGAVTQAHIHFGHRFSTGGVSVWLCDTATNPSPVATTPLCPASGSVTGTITAADVVGPSTQGIAAGEFSELLRAVRNRTTYVNVHSTTYPTGEIRSQLRLND
jgi:hypothetical protein